MASGKESKNVNGPSGSSSPLAVVSVSSNIPHGALRNMTPGAAINVLLSNKNKTLHGNSGGGGGGVPEGGQMSIGTGNMLNGDKESADYFHANGLNGSTGSISSEGSSATSGLPVKNGSGLTNGNAKG